MDIEKRSVLLMDLQTQIKELRDLLYFLAEKNTAIRKREELVSNYERGLEAAPKKNLPAAPVQPNAPRKPAQPKHVEADTKVHFKDFMLFSWYSFLIKAVGKKKTIKKAEEANAQLDKEYAEKMERYKKDYAQWEKDMKAYTDAYAKWQSDVKKKNDENIEKYKKANVNTQKEIKQLDAEIAEADKKIAASTVLSDKDKNSEVVLFLIDKLESGRADSIMMALNMYDAEKRQEAQFRAQLQMDAFNRQMEADRRKRWEAEQERAQWSHNRQMEEYARETRDYERQQAKDLEEIRKAADKLGR